MKDSVFVSFYIGIMMMILNNSCSLIGYGLGSGVDSFFSRSDTLCNIGERIQEIDTGTEIIVYLKNRRQTGGEFAEIKTIYPDSSYNIPVIKKYAQQSGWNLLTGDPITLFLRPSSKIDCEFIGFEDSCIVIRLKNKPKTTRTCLDRIIEIKNAQGQRLKGDQIRQFISEEKSRLRHEILLFQNGVTISIDSEDIECIYVLHETSVRSFGLGIGAIVDAGFIAFMIYMLTSYRK
jgi:hypothetical protein